MAKYTTEDFKKQVRELYPNIEILSEWVNAQSKIKCRCTIDNYEWEVYPRTIREKGCPKCNGSITRKLTDKEYKEKLYKIHNGNIESLEPYVNMNQKYYINVKSIIMSIMQNLLMLSVEVKGANFVLMKKLQMQKKILLKM